MIEAIVVSPADLLVESEPLDLAETNLGTDVPNRPPIQSFLDPDTETLNMATKFKFLDVTVERPNPNQNRKGPIKGK